MGNALKAAGVIACAIVALFSWAHYETKPEAIDYDKIATITPHDQRDATLDDEGERIEEDDPRWDCATMGNRQCGPAPAELPDYLTRA